MESLDFLYLASADPGAAAGAYVAAGAELLWDIRDDGTRVAAVRWAERGRAPLLLFANHLEAGDWIAIYRADGTLQAAVAAMRGAGWEAEAEPFELPPGPCALFRDPDGRRIGVYEETRPGWYDQFREDGS